MVGFIVAEIHLGVHLLLCGLPLSHVPTTKHPRDEDGRESNDKRSEEQPRLSVSLQNVPITDALSVIRQVEMVLGPQLDELVRNTAWSDGSSQRSAEETVT